jgi:hypothetical protein
LSWSFLPQEENSALGAVKLPTALKISKSILISSEEDSMNVLELKLQVAAVIEEIATINKFLAKSSPSLLAVQHALEEVSPDKFAHAYERNLLEPAQLTIAQELNSKAESLLESARLLRQS